MDKSSLMPSVRELMKLSNSHSQTPRLAVFHRAAAFINHRRIVVANVVITQPTITTEPTFILKAIAWSIPIVLALSRAISTCVVIVVSSRARPVSILITICSSGPLFRILIWQTPSPALAV